MGGDGFFRFFGLFIKTVTNYREDGPVTRYMAAERLKAAASALLLALESRQGFGWPNESRGAFVWSWLA